MYPMESVDHPIFTKEKLKKKNFLAVLQTIKTDGLFVLVCIEKMDVK